MSHCQISHCYSVQSYSYHSNSKIMLNNKYNIMYFRILLWLGGELEKEKHDMEIARRPERIILIRHGESQGNVNKSVYAKVPDSMVQLTDRGVKQAREAGRKLKELIGDETVRFFISPYKRSVQTFNHIVESSGIKKNRYTVREEPRIREQDWGNFQEPQKVKYLFKFIYIYLYVYIYKYINIYIFIYLCICL